MFASDETRRSTTEQVSTPPCDVTAPAPDSKALKQALIGRGKKHSVIEKPRSWLITGSKSNKESSSPNCSDDGSINRGKELSKGQPSTIQMERGRSGTDSFASFARRSWMSRSSRSPSSRNTASPSTDQAPSGLEGLFRTSSVKIAKAPHRLQVVTNKDQVGETTRRESLRSTQKPLALATSYLSKLKPKQQQSLFARDGADSEHSYDSSATSLIRTSNSIRTSASRSISSDGNTNTPTTDESCNESTPKPRDPLWSSFKMLDLEVKNFMSSKQTGQRVAQVQSMLLPFLRTTRDHPSTKTMALDDVERRAIILNKWWTLLLDMLQGPLQQPIPGMDRPMLLEAATMLMMRPEWRRSASFLQPLAERLPSERVRPRSGTSASGSTTDSFLLAESAEHNVKTMFVANLVKQMAYVVEKMSLRHAPLSLVNFSGKTCAYAFFFAPGVCDVLVRLWGLTPDLIRRSGCELGLPRKDKGESDDMVALFPPKLGGFGWSSPRAVWDSLKPVPKMPLTVARIPWTGPWVTRWKGRDTDLFFIFCKYFHILADQFMPPGLPLSEKARSPAFALVHAQLLSIFDATIHRQSSAVDHSLAAPFIDSVNGPDAPAALTLPLPANNNAMKGMSENRLIILLKDFLLDDAAELASARHTFAEAFAALTKAATRKTSLYNSAACFALCDFLEEVLMTYHGFESGSISYVDWPFWIEVCKRMSSSMNTITEVRMLSFIFTIWDAIAKDSRRKANVCLEWLLSEETFNSFFNNWCPMVRAYYQRLICWRMCRYTGGSSEVDMSIYLAAAARLDTSWAHYLYLKQDADEKGRTPPSTAPMSPAMGKKFIIIRQEASALQKGLFMGFDTFARSATRLTLAGSETAPDTRGPARPDARKRWSLLGKMFTTMGSSSSPESASGGLPRSLSDSAVHRRELGEPAPLVAGSRQQLSGASKNKTKTAPSEDGSLGSSPVYDEQRYIFKFILGWQQNPGLARERVLSRPRLPVPTQARVTAQSRPHGTWLVAPCSPSSQSPAQSPPQTPRPLLLQNGDDVNLTASVEEWLRNTPTSSASFEGADDKHGKVGENRSDMVDGLHTSTQSLTAVNVEGTVDKVIKPTKPAGIFAKNLVYCGSALAEWSQVVSECNIFTERRQDDGVERLCDVEVPILGVEGFRKLGV
ncbi:hypothetical protein UVI_02048490 [Ustilaginoidea virens]|nr:hypothetical protein UVI_02048490 [Ustilaginoidea virens]